MGKLSEHDFLWWTQIANFSEHDGSFSLEIVSILKIVSHAERQIEQLYRRIILKESIPHNEKVFSVFEEYTEWLCKEKQGFLLS